MNDPSTAEARERLNAYLDGELQAEERSDIERDLAADAELQDEFRRLQRAWDLLDELPRADVNASFTQSTVEMIALDTADEIAATQAKPRGALLDRWLIAGGVLAAAIGGFLAVDAWRGRPDDALLRDLRVIENIDLLGRTEPGETGEFFRKLEEHRVRLPLPNNSYDSRNR
ncbi:MAG: hypothetical protein JNL96_03530 [Planctomycetaceae bacterium]|nr:hypothetical protein [Planctomycetaceae bacterium]